jgi:hypothetical protein
MNKLSLDALKERAEGVASEELMLTITGGIQEACHDTFNDAMMMDAQNSNNSAGSQIIGWIMSWF